MMGKNGTDKKCPFVKNGINTVKLIKSCGWNSVYSNLKNISQKQPIYLSKNSANLLLNDHVTEFLSWITCRHINARFVNF